MAAEKPSAPVRPRRTRRRRAGRARCRAGKLSRQCDAAWRGRGAARRSTAARANGSRGLPRPARSAWRLTVERRTREPEDDSRRLARLCAGQAHADGLAGRESNGAWRREAHPGDDAANDCRAGEAGAAGSDRHRGRRAVRTHAPSGDRRAAAAPAIPRNAGCEPHALFRRRSRRRACGVRVQGRRRRRS